MDGGLKGQNLFGLIFEWSLKRRVGTLEINSKVDFDWMKHLNFTIKILIV